MLLDYKGKETGPQETERFCSNQKSVEVPSQFHFVTRLFSDLLLENSLSNVHYNILARLCKFIMKFGEIIR